MATKQIIADFNKGEKLNGENYDIWHRKVVFILEDQEVSEALHHTMIEPPNGNTTQHRRDIQAWKKKNTTARITSLSSMENDLMC